MGRRSMHAATPHATCPQTSRASGSCFRAESRDASAKSNEQAEHQWRQRAEYRVKSR